MQARARCSLATMAIITILPLLSQHAVAEPGILAKDPEAYVRGKKIYERCAACHALDADRTGPRHCGLIGRRAGSVPGFAYSSAMRRSKIVWTEANLDRFLKSPLTTVPGTAMGYDGIKDDRERHDLIRYLHAASLEQQCHALISNTQQDRK